MHLGDNGRLRRSLLLLLLLSLYKLHADLVLLALGQGFLLLLSQNTLETLDLIGDVHDKGSLRIHLLLSCGRCREVLACQKAWCARMSGCGGETRGLSIHNHCCC